MASSTGATTYLLNHIVLPPNLPHTTDKLPGHERALIEVTTQALQDLKSHSEPEHGAIVTQAIATVQRLSHIRDNTGEINEGELLKELDKLVNGDSTGSIPIEVSAQNAGLLISRDGTYIVFEAFELSPTNQQSMACIGRLRRTFPGPSSRVLVSKMQEVGFKESISTTLARMAHEAAAEFQPSARSNTADPSIVTDYLINAIAAMGEPTELLRIVKHTRDDVLSSKNASLPWRRSPLWLLIRVVLQLGFKRSASSTSESVDLYKAFGVLLLSRLLEKVKDHMQTNDVELVRALSMKLDRRMRKLESLRAMGGLQSNWQRTLRENLHEVHGQLDANWREAVQLERSCIDPANLSALRAHEDLDMALPQLDAYLPQATSIPRSVVAQDFEPTSTFPQYSAETIPSSLGAADEDQVYRLLATEDWVEKHLKTWIQSRINNPATCGELLILMKAYYRSANAVYAGNVANMSLMYLTLCEVWLQCDILACSKFPLLQKYDPEVHLEELQSLCLPRRTQMERLHLIETYVQARRKAATKAYPSIFTKFGDASSFAVKYYDSDDGADLQALLAEVQRVATEKQHKKCGELQALQGKYLELMKLYDETSCEYEGAMTDDEDEEDGDANGKLKHSQTCSRCAAKSEANGLSIAIFEWPLPDNMHEAKAAIFELKAPEAFSHWRDATYYFITTVLGIRDESPKKLQYVVGLESHHDLKSMLPERHRNRRIAIVSSTKSHMSKNESIPISSSLQEAMVCLKSALTYKYYDTKNKHRIDGARKHTEKIIQACSVVLPDSSKTIKRYVTRTPSTPDGLPSNEVIAGQHQCPAHFSIDEFKAFCTVPLGCEITLENILIQLANPVLDFAKTETQHMMQHIIHQAGPPTKGRFERMTHITLADSAFCSKMLEQLESSLRRISENWESCKTLATFSVLTRRMLSLNKSHTITESGLRHLTSIRNICLRWLHTLEDRLATSTDHVQRSELYLRTLEIALLGTSTFDVEADLFPNTLKDSNSVSALIRCCIKVKENEELLRSDAEVACGIMYHAWRRLMYEILPILRKRLLDKSDGLNQAVRMSWNTFCCGPSTQWVVSNKPQQRWLKTNSGSLFVHYDLLTGNLLVNGLPLTRLPLSYTQNRMYERLFGKTILEVGPSDEIDMQFAAKSARQGHSLHFGMRQNDMLLLAIKDKSRLELLPRRLFEESLPQAFTSNYVHWFDRSRNEVLFRNHEDPWHSSDDTWSLKRLETTWRLVKGSDSLINMSSSSACTILQIFRPLEDANHIHIKFNHTIRSIDISLPRLQLDFYIQPQTGQVRSRQYRAMIVDCNQNIGTLVGLASKLVLCGEGSTERMVLVPLPKEFRADSVTYEKVHTPHHVSVTISKEATSRVCAYALDLTLQRLVDTGDLQSKLLLSYLHALTSHCLPDPFTGRSGSEAALDILRSASTRSFDTLTQENVSLLVYIAKLTPGRTAHSEDMQQVHWDPDLPTSSQHPEFFGTVKAIFDEAQRNLFLHPQSDFSEPKEMPHIKSHLLERDTNRMSSFRVDGYGAENFTRTADLDYRSREVNPDAERGKRAFIAAGLIERSSAALHAPLGNLKSGLFSGRLKDTVIRSASRIYDIKGLRFDNKWLEDSAYLLSEQWCSLHAQLPKALKKVNRFNIVLWLSIMAYSTTAEMDAIQTLGAFFRLKDMASFKPPTASASFNLTRGNTWVASEIHDIIKENTKPRAECPEFKIPREEDEAKGRHTRRVNALIKKNQKIAVDKFFTALSKQWPRVKPSTPSDKDIRIYVDVTKAMVEVRSCFKAWHDCQRFYDYLDRLSAIVARQDIDPISVSLRVVNRPVRSMDAGMPSGQYALHDILAAPAPTHAEPDESLFVSETETYFPGRPAEPDVTMIEQATALLSPESHDQLERVRRDLSFRARLPSAAHYVAALRDSHDALMIHETGNRTGVAQVNIDTQKLLKEHLKKCSDYLENLYSDLIAVVRGEPGSCKEVAFSIQHGPRISPTTWLKLLNRDYFDALSDPWKATIIEYGRAITSVHRAQRMLGVADKPSELAAELRNVGHSNWSPREFPETLLLEAESGIMVREVQETIAAEMRDPPNNENAVCQLNMGEGKSSVIVPILAATLSDRQTLVRIVVAKPQSNQMLQVLAAKLGGLLNRRIYQLQFSRDLRPSKSEADIILSICRECMENRGVILAQPEHILSFKLMGLEHLLTGQNEVASSLLNTQQFFDQQTRDIVDESDENFSPRFELVYTMGSQQAIDFAPRRWSIISQLLGLVFKFAPEIQKENRTSVAIEVLQAGDGKVPRVRILRQDAADVLLDKISEHIINHGLIGFSTRAFSSPSDKAALKDYISQPLLTLDEIRAVQESILWTESTKDAILLIRGLIACGILRFVLFRKRWRVDFGLNPSRVPRTSLATPYKFKDEPSPRAEFSHPDVLITLTLLSYYYGGLNDQQMFITFQHLSNSDQSAIEYSEWVSTAANSLPATCRTLSGINIKDRQHCIQHVFPHLRFSKACIEYFLSRLVFPKEIRQFTSKLSASGWDLGATKTNPTTGFSGTKDAMHLLPLAVKHLDLPSQSHIDALVLGYLLETSSVEALAPRESANTDAEYVLASAVNSEPEVRVVIDCGAAILEQSNKQVAETWLMMTNPANVHAAVYFEEEELSILDRNGRVESFQTSPFAKQLDVCVVYLDEAHTRGIDLRLPRHYRACLTLGSCLTKDKLIQGCMRMRQLGKGQSVVFLVPEEIVTKICEITKNKVGDEIKVQDVLTWAVIETWTDLRKTMPSWAIQGHRFISREHVRLDSSLTSDEAGEFLEDEGQTLETRYLPGQQGDKLSTRCKKWNKSNAGIADILQRCKDFGSMQQASADLEDEQERELAPEQEEERELELPERMEAATHVLHANVENLVKSGTFPATMNQFTPAFQALSSTSIAQHCDLSQLPTDLLVTTDFMRTVKQPAGTEKTAFLTDSFQRQVQWVLSVPNKAGVIQNLVIISPHEANKLMQILRRKTAKVTLHLFSPRTNSSYASLDKLDLFTIGCAFTPNSVPRSLIVQLNLFAGSLYLRSYSEYIELCDFLGLLHGDATPDQQVGADGFITPPAGKWGLMQSPVPLLRALLMRIRKEGEGLEKTHLGKILNGVRLEEAEFREDIEMADSSDLGEDVEMANNSDLPKAEFGLEDEFLGFEDEFGGFEDDCGEV